MDMQEDMMGATSFGRAAMKKIQCASPNFRIYEAEWLGDTPKEWDTMKVTGAEFREATRGPNKGKLTVMVKGTKRTVYVSLADMDNA